MKLNRDQIKGRVEKTLGRGTRNEDLETTGTVDHAPGDAKAAVGHLGDQVERIIDKAKDRLRKK